MLRRRAADGRLVHQHQLVELRHLHRRDVRRPPPPGRPGGRASPGTARARARSFCRSRKTPHRPTSRASGKVTSRPRRLFSVMPWSWRNSDCWLLVAEFFPELRWLTRGGVWPVAPAVLRPLKYWPVKLSLDLSISANGPSKTRRPAALAREGADFHQMVGRAHHGLVVLDNHHRIAPVGEAAQDADEAVDVARVQADTRLIEHKQRFHQRGAETRR